MKRIFHLTLAMASLLAPAALTSAHAAPMRYTFYDCGTNADCVTQPPTVLTQFTTSGVIEAPAVPPAGNITQVQEVPVDDVLAGDFDELGIFTFNTNGRIGSMFVFYGLVPANGREVTPVSAIASAFTQSLTLNWVEGTYTGLATANCFNVRCTQQTTIRGFVKLVAEIDDGTPPGTLPEPSALALAGLALGLGFATRRFSGTSGRR